MSRRAILMGGGTLLSAATLLGAAPAALARSGQSLILEVACDGRTFRLVRKDPMATDQLPSRGDTFIVNGKIYPAGTIASGLSGPDQPGSIGTWICRGWFYVEDLATQTPHAATTQIYFQDDGSSLTSDGLEGGITSVRAVSGGTGRWAGVSGSVIQEEVDTNDTLLDLGPVEVPAPNIRFTFSLRQ
jgi:hypothetical protein